MINTLTENYLTKVSNKAISNIINLILDSDKLYKADTMKALGIEKIMKKD